MALPRFAKVVVEDQELGLVQDRVKAATDALANIALLDGLLLEGIVLTSGAFQPLAHRLGRPWRGYLVLARSANAQVWSQTPGNDASTFLYLQPSASVTVTLWVF